MVPVVFQSPVFAPGFYHFKEHAARVREALESLILRAFGRFTQRVAEHILEHKLIIKIYFTIKAHKC
jgi:hypothetical protein